jgi:hypothetical protein
MATKFPEQVQLEPDEVFRINRIRIAEKFHKWPHEVDCLSAAEVEDILELMWADDKLAPK